jgi:endonuclease/exonuclease/phosphatase (EEP) superfamily protein YafD
MRQYGRWPATAQANQAADVHALAASVDEPAIFGIDSNSPNASYGGRAALIRRKWTTAANSIDIVAWQHGIQMIGTRRTITIPSDHGKGVVITFTTNTGTDQA